MQNAIACTASFAVAETLVFTWGNPSRGDDALGPIFGERLHSLNIPNVECITDFQLQVEHALDLRNRKRVLFVDASLSGNSPFQVEVIQPEHDSSFSSHTLRPNAVLQVYCNLHDEDPPPAWLLAIRAYSCELGAPLSEKASAHLEIAINWASNWLNQPFTSLPIDMVCK